MCNASPKHQSILAQINTFTDAQIEDFLVRHNFELSCLLKYNLNSEKLNKIKTSILKEKIENEGIDKLRLQEGGLTQSKINEIFEVQKFTCSCGQEFTEENIFISHQNICEPPKPPGPSPEPNTLLEEIKNNQASIFDIQQAFLNNEISNDDLRSIGLSDKVIENIRNFEFQAMSEVETTQLPNLKKDRTDFYFLGLPASGKSCLIASVLSYLQNSGQCRRNVDNQRSTEYFRKLVGPFTKGYLPNRTSTSFIDYIDLTLRVQKESRGLFGRTNVERFEIPANILDMAGEKLSALAQGKEKDFGQHQKYLFNRNPKAIFLIIDYDFDENRDGNSFDQQTDLETGFLLLKSWGILDRTESVYLMVTKADCFDGRLDEYDTKAQNFVKNKYNGLYATLKELESDYGFSLEIMAYSIGACMLGSLLVDPSPETNPHLKVFPEKLAKRILNHTAGYRTGRRGIFTN